MSFFQDNLNFLKLIKRYIILSGIILVAGLVVGMFLPAEIKYQFLTMLQDKASKMGQVNGLTIFINNISVSLLMILSGLLLIFPLLIVFYNGLAIGGILSLFGPVMGWPEILSTIMIHGIFELTAFILAGALGVMLTLQVLRRSPLHLSWPDFLLKLANAVFIFILPLLIAAAVMESTVSQAYMMHVNSGLYQHSDIDTLTNRMAQLGYLEEGSSFREYVDIKTRVPALQKPLPLIVNFTNSEERKIVLMINESNHNNDIQLQSHAMNSNLLVLSNKTRVYYIENKSSIKQLYSVMKVLKKIE